MSVARILGLVVIIVVLPGAILAVVAAAGWIRPTSTWEWISWLLVSAAAWATFLGAFVEVERRISEWSDRRRLKLPRRDLGTPEFPFERVSPRELASRLPNLQWPEIPYVSRLPAVEQEHMLAEMLQASRLLILGRTGLGKTREAVELVRRIEAEKGEPVIVLLPQGTLDVPLKPPPDLPTRNLILFIDNLPALYAEPFRIRDIDDPKLIEADFRQRFEQTIRYFSDYCRGYDFRVIATAIGEPKLRDRLRLGDPFWVSFQIQELPDLSPRRRLDLLGALEVHFDIEIAPQAKKILSERSDGTFGGLIVPLLKERSKEQITLASAKNYRCIYPQDWEQTVYRQVIEPNVYRRNLLDALSIVREADLISFEFLVIDLAARLCSKYGCISVLGQISPKAPMVHQISILERLRWFLGVIQRISMLLGRWTAQLAPRLKYTSKYLIFWHRWQLRRSLRQLSDWIRVSEDILSCPDAYLSGKGDFLAAKPELLASVLNVIRRHKYFLLLCPSLYRLIDVLRYELDDYRSALDLNWAILKSDPSNARAWNSIAQIYLNLGYHEDATKACLIFPRKSGHRDKLRV